MSETRHFPRVVVGMSGGVDSSLAAALLLEQGYDVVGVTILPTNPRSPGSEGLETQRQGVAAKAGRVCETLHIPHIVIDVEEEFRAKVIGPFVTAYLEGKTPNPCVLCNPRIKWACLGETAVKVGAERIATGHYARVRWSPSTGRAWIARGTDAVKDQSYMLWGLSQEQLARTLFPLGGMTKREVRMEARARGLDASDEPESYDICFIPDDDYRRYLRATVEMDFDALQGGPVIYEGRCIGRHEGYPFYTIGQRRGLNAAIGVPLYVVGIDPRTNTVFVDRKERTGRNFCIVGNVMLQKYPRLTRPIRVIGRIRFRDRGSPALIIPRADGRIEVLFDEPRSAITPGQSAVWYEGDDLVGGGIIEAVAEKSHVMEDHDR
ncbi:MAG: tRNA 2-thiouridine(34) synthase MnmA [Bacteroidota bacterium]|nr:tRNA 2-thiouridine(34) synthase MnmA [Bacteroidota bacterium]